MFAIQTFKSLQDAANDKEFATKSEAGGGSSTYDLPTASSTTKGGVMIGAGLSMNGDTLSVTLDSGEKYSVFEGATSSKGGASGLVPAPVKGDQAKYLRGDGSWASLNLVVNGGGSAITLGTEEAATQGALWQDYFTDNVGNKTPVLKLRYGDYEYNFNYDTLTPVSTAAPALVTDFGVQYNLRSTLSSTQQGGLWYEVTNDTPALKMHRGIFDYGYNYDTITYKGTNANLYSYMPLDSTTADALKNIAWGVGANATVTDAPYGGKALKNTDAISFGTDNSSKLFGNVPWTIDFWISFEKISALPKDDVLYRFCYLNIGGGGDYTSTLDVFVQNG